MKSLLREFLIYFSQSLIYGVLIAWTFGTSLLLDDGFSNLISLFCVIGVGLLSGFAYFPQLPFWCLATLGTARLSLSLFGVQFPRFGWTALSMKSSMTIALHLILAYGIGLMWLYGFRYFFGRCPESLALDPYLNETTGLPMNEGVLVILLLLAALGTSLGLWANERWIGRRERSCQA